MSFIKSASQRQTRPTGMPLMTESDVAKVCGVHVQTIRRWRRLGTGPPWMRLDRRVAYDPAALWEW
jgi:Helix-turn-helix domain